MKMATQSRARLTVPKLRHYRKSGKCPACLRPYNLNYSGRILAQQERAVQWLLRNKRLWVGKKVENGYPGRHEMTDAWLLCAWGLKRAKIYRESYGNWDMSLDKLCKKAEWRMGACRP